ncbi:MAG: DHHW family protein [Eubacterium sp.]|nr:DHHW family protein [Eubacterium sp.]MCM1419772.1 DHHW family protein [Roseburia sp.]
MKLKIAKMILVVGFFLLLAALPILTFLNLPAEERPFSENENRYLAAFPKVTAETYLNKEAMEGFEDWFADRFYGREDWIRAKNATERLLGKVEINGVYTVDDRMMQAWEGFDPEFIDRNLAAVSRFAERYPDLPVYFLLAPTSQEIYAGLLPKSAPVGSQSELNSYCREGIGRATLIDVFPALKSNAESYIYYRTDHHWTSYGAYIAYTEAAKSMGFQSEPLSSFHIEHASSDFRGTLYSKTLDNGVTPDVIDYYHFNEGAASPTLMINSGTEVREYDSIYLREYLETKDKYSSFLGSNVPLLTITSEGSPNDRSLLVFKDSYAHSMLPFLANHYSKITVLDLRLLNQPYTALVDPSDYDSVLILYNAITFSEDTNIRKLNMG